MKHLSLLLLLLVACGPEQSAGLSLGDPCSPLTQDCETSLVCAMTGADAEAGRFIWECSEPTETFDYPQPYETNTDYVTGLCWASTKVSGCDADLCCVVTCEVGVDSCEGFPDHPYCDDLAPTDPIGS